MSTMLAIVLWSIPSICFAKRTPIGSHGLYFVSSPIIFPASTIKAVSTIPRIASRIKGPSILAPFSCAGLIIILRYKAMRIPIAAMAYPKSTIRFQIPSNWILLRNVCKSPPVPRSTISLISSKKPQKISACAYPATLS